MVYGKVNSLSWLTRELLPHACLNTELSFPNCLCTPLAVDIITTGQAPLNHRIGFSYSLASVQYSCCCRAYHHTCHFKFTEQCIHNPQMMNRVILLHLQVLGLWREACPTRWATAHKFRNIPQEQERFAGPILCLSVMLPVDHTHKTRSIINIYPCTGRGHRWEWALPGEVLLKHCKTKFLLMVNRVHNLF